MGRIGLFVKGCVSLAPRSGARFLPAFLAALLLTGQAAHAQNGPQWGQWFHGPTEFREYEAWVMSPEGNYGSTMSILCAADRPFLFFEQPAGAKWNSVDTAAIAVDGRTWRLEARYLEGGDTGWWVRPDAGLLQALQSGSRVTTTVRGQRISYELRGSAQAIDASLAGCGSGNGHNPRMINAYNFYCPDNVSEADLGDPNLDVRPCLSGSGSAPAAQPGLAQAAYVAPREGCPSLAPLLSYRDANGQAPSEYSRIFCGDFSGDGQPDAFAQLLYESGGNSMFPHVALFQNEGGTLRFLRTVPEFYGSPSEASFSRNKVTLKLTTLLPGEPRCCPTGSEIRQVDVPTGRHAVITD